MDRPNLLEDPLRTLGTKTVPHRDQMRFVALNGGGGPQGQGGNPALLTGDAFPGAELVHMLQEVLGRGGRIGSEEVPVES